MPISDLERDLGVKWEYCPECGGQGSILVEALREAGQTVASKYKPCPKCKGKGGRYVSLDQA